jgi:hypothetical protein
MIAVRQALLILFALVMMLPPAGAQPGASSAPGDVRSGKSDSYLLGMVGAAHVIVIHDYLELLERQSALNAPSAALTERLTFLSAHCGRLISDLKSQTTAGPGAHGELRSLMILAQKECQALHRKLAFPSDSAEDDYQHARSQLAAELERLAGTEAHSQSN